MMPLGCSVARRFGPKALPPKHTDDLVDHGGTLFRPSTAPIAHPVHQKLEAARRAEVQAQLDLGRQAAAEKERALTERGTRRDGPTREAPMQKSSIPINWPGGDHYFRNMQSSAQELQHAYKWSKPMQPYDQDTITCSAGRMAGGKAWHGDAKYAYARPLALKSFKYTAAAQPHAHQYIGAYGGAFTSSRRMKTFLA